MSAEFLLKVAAALDEIADVLDEQEREKQAVVLRSRDEALQSVASKYAAATGEELPDDVKEKLAASGEDIIATVRTMVEKTSSAAVESLGRASEKSAHLVPRTRSEAKDAAWDRFGSFINS